MFCKSLEQFLNEYLENDVPYMDLYFENNEHYKDLYNYAKQHLYDTRFQVIMGYLYKYGEAGEKNPQLAFEHFYKAAINDNNIRFCLIIGHFNPVFL